MKTIAIIGGGISGAALLHYLNEHYAGRSDVSITLFEKSSRLGGTIHSMKHEGAVFETGPNGFLNSKERTLNFIKELGLEDRLISAAEASAIRYLCLNHKLHEFPKTPGAFFRFPLLNFTEKLRILREPFIAKGKAPNETVYEFGVRRFGKKFTDVFLDPFVSGVHGGNSKELVLKYAFPTIYALEQKFGSIMWGQFSTSKNKGTTKGHLTSFTQGMDEVINRVYQKYKDQIFLNYEVRSINKDDERYRITSSIRTTKAEEVYLCCPAFVAGTLLEKENALLAQSLKEIYYAPMVVVGLVYDQSISRVKGYGYLKPSHEQLPVLGSLFEHNIFPQRYENNKSLFRVMLGGSRNPDILNMHKDQLIALAREELAKTVRIDAEPEHVFFQAMKQAIPQYDGKYAQAYHQIDSILKQYPTLHVAANYWKGVSFNDCIENAYQAATTSSL